MIAPYHWDDLDKLAIDEVYCYQTYKRMLADLVPVLNRQHCISWSNRSWEILIGPWLRRYVCLLFDRWECIRCIEKKYDISSVACAPAVPGAMITKNFVQFDDSSLSDNWNYLLISKIVRDVTNFDIEEIEVDIRQDEISSLENSTFRSINILNQLKRTLKSVLKGIYGSTVVRKVYSLFSKSNKFHISRIHFPSIFKELVLSVRLGNFPYSDLKEYAFPDLPHNLDQRKKINLVQEEQYSRFENYARGNLAEFVPKVYIEGFHQMLSMVAKLGYPSSPEIICTGTSFYRDEVRQAWIAEKVGSGAKLVGVQHGGAYAITRVTGEALPHELSICNTFLSWGWQIPGYDIRPMPSPKLIGRKGSWDANGHIVIVGKPRLWYMRGITTISLPGEAFRAYSQDFIDLLNNLPAHENKNVYVRLFPGKIGEEEGGAPLARELRASFPGLNVIPKSQSLEEYLVRSKLNIFTYNGTPFLESIGLDRPCIVVFRPERDPISKLALPYYQALEKVGVYHKSVESAVRHIELVSTGVVDWWNSPETRRAKSEFCSQFVRISNDGIGDYYRELKSLV